MTIRKGPAILVALTVLSAGASAGAADPPAKAPASPAPTKAAAPAKSTPAPIDIHKMHMVLEVHDAAGALLSTIDFPDYTANGMFTVQADKNHSVVDANDVVIGFSLDGHAVVTIKDGDRTAIKITGEHIVVRRTPDADSVAAKPEGGKPVAK